MTWEDYSSVDRERYPAVWQELRRQHEVPPSSVELGRRRRVLWYGYDAGGVRLQTDQIVRFVNNLQVT